MSHDLKMFVIPSVFFFFWVGGAGSRQKVPHGGLFIKVCSLTVFMHLTMSRYINHIIGTDVCRMVINK